MFRIQRLALPLTALCGLTLVLAAGKSQAAFGPRDATVGQPAPALTAFDLKGKPASLAPYAGKVIVLNFADPLCGFCHDEAPHLQQGWKKYKKKGVEVVMVLLPTGTNPYKTASKFKNQHHLTFPVLVDNPDFASNTAYGIDPLNSGYPENIVIDQQGVIRYFEVGFDGAAIDQIVTQLTSGH